MPIPPRIAERFNVAGTLISALLALMGALAMRDHIRLVDILILFFGGVGTGFGLAMLITRRRAAVPVGP